MNWWRYSASRVERVETPGRALGQVLRSVFSTNATIESQD